MMQNVIISAGVSKELIGRWREGVIRKYQELQKGLPEDHVWRGKLKHSLETEKFFREADFPNITKELEIDFISLVILSHDIGRLTPDGQRHPERHGECSTAVLRELIKLPENSELWRIFSFVVENHNRPRIEQRPESEIDKIAFWLLSILRDFDKRETFRKDKALRYVSDKDYKRKQIKANWSPGFNKGETNSIEPKSLINDFQRRESLNRGKCESYEAYMLQYLSWVFDVSNPNILREILDEGGPKIVLDYLEKQLDPDSDSFKRIKKAYEEFIKTIGL